ncbi:hypothetical protein KC319_g318 [Hortaea werneckii]|nr:hypothetical protein KC352_g6755 [Hortaea werneckii]KAI7573172.1 hypothetical protein KC317_g110 [Hortaea werneckii]KAI7628183.1 hypothetical protein KC346_g340 [Hortaea werneckii]KAI7683744.1 hypothetical protein KC319_g318 [Hortaea werneckii]KAI7723296.1 hypothetical protein KC322_g1108 [Hortaea werneckii]
MSDDPCIASVSQHRRKRRKVADEDRKRATVACTACRRLKEKCDGTLPCQRCQKHGRKCEASGKKPQQQPCADDSERTRHLEGIARHFLGDVPLDLERLRMVSHNLQTASATTYETPRPGVEDTNLQQEHYTVKPVAQDTAHYSGEFSHWNFSERVREQLRERLPPSQADSLRHLEYWRATQLHPKPLQLPDLPPRTIAEFLVHSYFANAQTNVFLVTPDWTSTWLDEIYHPAYALTVSDAPCVCSLLTILAIGSSFAHLLANDTDEPTGTHLGPGEEAADEIVSVGLYQAASRLTPEIIATASCESVRAFLLLANFALPLDTQGLGYTYSSLAVRMAIQNGMHRMDSTGRLSPSSNLDQRRLWWTAYRLQKRISILHGRPACIAVSDTDVPIPDQPQQDGSTDVNHHLQHENTMSRLTEWLGEASHSVHALRRCPKSLRHSYFARLWQTYDDLRMWWSAHPLSSGYSGGLDRSILHLQLSYHLNVVFIGRPFVFSTRTTSPQLTDNNRTADSTTRLLQHAIDSAHQIIDLCREADSTIGLARASYVEFSSCRAAILLLLAHRLNQETATEREKVEVSIQLMRNMTWTNMSAKSETSVIVAIDEAIKRSNTDVDGNEDPAALTQSPYASFLQWATEKRQQEKTVASIEPAPPSEDSGMIEVLESFDWSLFDSPLSEMWAGPAMPHNPTT